LTEFTVRLALLFFPGIICALLVENLVPTRGWTNVRFALYAFVLGFGCYLLYALGLAIFVWQWPPDVWLLKALTDTKAISDEEICIVTGLSVLVGLIVSNALNRHWLHSFAKLMGVSRHFGDMDVWAYTFNSTDVANEWVVVRDLNHDLMFEGWVSEFSDTFAENELLIREVKVYRSSTAEFLYQVDALYLARNRNNLTIEFRSS
jgi:hypothetical protein